MSCGSDAPRPGAQLERWQTPPDSDSLGGTQRTPGRGRALLRRALAGPSLELQAVHKLRPVPVFFCFGRRGWDSDGGPEQAGGPAHSSHSTSSSGITGKLGSDMHASARVASASFKNLGPGTAVQHTQPGAALTASLLYSAAPTTRKSPRLSRPHLPRWLVV